jgi:hypothetical protein
MEVLPLGGLISLAVILPNLLAVLFPPKAKVVDKTTPDNRSLKSMIIIERLGQMGSFMLPFFYRLHFVTVLKIYLFGVMIGILALYYAGWIRYLLNGRAEELFYRSMLGVPLPMALMPVIYFFLASVLLESIWISLAALLLGIGHLRVSWIRSKIIQQPSASV